MAARKAGIFMCATLASLGCAATGEAPDGAASPIDGAGTPDASTVDQVTVGDRRPEGDGPGDGQPSVSLTAGLIAHFGFDEGHGAGVKDSSGSGNHGTIMQSGIARGGLIDPVLVHPSPTWGSGVSGSAVVFDGIDDWIGVPDSHSLDSIADTGEVSISLWAHSADFTAIRDVAVLCQRHVLGERVEYFALAGRAGKLAGVSHPYFWATAADPIPKRRWVHLSMTRDRDVMRIYVNGDEVGMLAISKTPDGAPEHPLTPDVTPLSIGAGINEEDVIEHFTGRLDELRIYNRALSSAEVQALFEAHRQAAEAHGVEPLIDLRAGLVGHWDLSQRKYDEVGDVSGTMNNGALVRGGIVGPHPGPAAWSQAGTALHLNGVDEAVLVPASQSIDRIGVNNALTVTARVNLDEVVGPRPHNRFVARHRKLDNRLHFALGLFEASPAARVNEVEVAARSRIALGRRVDVAMTFDGAVLALYVDGTEEGRAAISTRLAPDDTPVTIGARIDEGTDGQTLLEHMQGHVDDVRLYDRALSAAEVATLARQP